MVATPLGMMEMQQEFHDIYTLEKNSKSLFHYMYFNNYRESKIYSMKA